MATCFLDQALDLHFVLLVVPVHHHVNVPVYRWLATFGVGYSSTVRGFQTYWPAGMVMFVAKVDYVLQKVNLK